MELCRKAVSRTGFRAMEVFGTATCVCPATTATDIDIRSAADVKMSSGDIWTRSSHWSARSHCSICRATYVKHVQRVVTSDKTLGRAGEISHGWNQPRAGTKGKPLGSVNSIPTRTLRPAGAFESVGTKGPLAIPSYGFSTLPAFASATNSTPSSSLPSRSSRWDGIPSGRSLLSASGDT